MAYSAAIADAFESAKRDFIKHFPEGADYNVSRFPTIDHVYEAAAQIQNEQAETRTMRNLAKIRPFLEGLKEYGNVVETFVQVKPEILALIWGPIKLLLLVRIFIPSHRIGANQPQVSSTFIRCFDKILDAMAKIGAVLPAFQRYTELFQGNTQIHHVLCLFFGDILEFYATILHLFNHRRWNIVFESLWPRYSGKIQVVLDHIEKHRMLMNVEVTLASVSEASIARRLALEEYEKAHKYQQRQEFDTMMNTINPHLYDQELEHFSRNCTAQAGNWLSTQNQYLSWMDVRNEDAKLLWIEGIPGAGKTYLSSTVIHHLQTRKDPLAFVFLSYRSPENASALKVFHSIIFQLVLDHMHLQPILPSAHKPEMRQLKSSTRYAKELFKKLLIGLPTTYIVADGLDEVSESERALLLQLLLELTEEQDNLKLLIGSRAEDDISQRLGSQVQLIRVHENNGKDIAAYVDERAATWLKTRWTEPRLAKKIRQLMKPIATYARGMFLYARLVCDSIVVKGDLNSVREAVENLPNGLNEAYDRVISRIEEDLEETERQEARVILGLVACSVVPLSIHEFRLAVFTYRGRDPSAGCQDLFLNVLQRCGPIVEEVDGNIQFVHFTLQEYLLGFQSNHYLEEAETHRKISRICLKYLSSSCFEPNMPDNLLVDNILSGAYVLENYICLYWLGHVEIALRNGLLDLQSDLKELLDSRRNDNFMDEAVYRTKHFEAIRTEDTYVYTRLHQAYNFSSIRRRELCFTEGDIWQDLDPLTISTFQLRFRRTIESLLCEGRAHQLDCACSALRNFYGDQIFKCGRPGCPFFRVGFRTRIQRDRHMEAHTRPYKCDRAGCSFFDFGFRTQALLTHHFNQHHKDSMAKTGITLKKLINKDELRPILEDAVMENDLEFVRDTWEEARKYGETLLLTAVRESSSPDMLEYLLRRVKLGKNLDGLLKLFLAAADKENLAVFRAYNVQQLAVSYKMELGMVEVLRRVADRRSPELTEVVWCQIPATEYLTFLSRLIPPKQSLGADRLALECYHKILEVSPRRHHGPGFQKCIRELGTRCCSIALAKFFLKNGADVEGSVSNRNELHTPLYAASGNMSLEAAQLMQFLLENGAASDVTYHKLPLRERPGAKNIHRWLGITWDDLVAAHGPQPPDESLYRVSPE